MPNSTAATPRPPQRDRTRRATHAPRATVAVLTVVAALAALLALGAGTAQADTGGVQAVRSIVSSANPAYLDELPQLTITLSAPTPDLPVPTGAGVVWFYKGDAVTPWGGASITFVNGTATVQLPDMVRDGVVDGLLYVDTFYGGDSTYAPFRMFHYAQQLVPRPAEALHLATTDLGSIPAGTTRSRTVDLVNDGTSPLTVVAAVAETGSWLTAPTDSCLSGLASRATCRLTLTARPDAPGPLAATLVFFNGVHRWNFSITATAEPAPISIDIPATALGNFITNAPVTRTVTVTNTTAAPLTVQAAVPDNTWLSLPPDACPGTLAPHGVCTIELTVNPTAAGSLAADVTFSAGTYQRTERFTASAAAFGAIPYRTSDQVIVGDGHPEARIDYPATRPGVAITSIAAEPADEFRPDPGDCTDGAETGQCVFTVWIRPTAFGQRTFDVIVRFASGQEARVHLSLKVALLTTFAVATPSGPLTTSDRPTITATVRSDLPGAPPATGSVVVREIGATPATVIGEGPVVDGVASITLPAMTVGNHLLSVRYGGNDAYSYDVRTITLTVTGRPSAQATPSDLGIVSSMTVRRVTVTNTGDVPIHLTDAPVTSATIVATTCVAPIAPGGTCVVDLTKIGPIGPVAFDLPFLADKVAVPVHITASAEPAGAVAASTRLDLGKTYVRGTASQSTAVTFGAGVTADVAPTVVPASAPFRATFDAATGRLTVTFAPTAAGAASADVRLPLSDGSTLVVTAVGQALPVPTFTTSTTGFGTVPVGYESQARITVTNTGDAALSFTATVASGPFAIAASDCVALPAHGTCTVTLRIVPPSPGAFTGLVLLWDGLGTSALTGITVTGTAANISVSAADATFGKPTLGEAALRSITITNRGAVPVGIVSIGTDRSEFTIVSTGSCLSGLAPTRSCTVQVRFVPTVAGPLTGRLTVALAQGGTVGAALSGTGTVRVPRVTDLRPARGPRSGGTRVTIVGTDLAAATTVRFGARSVPATCTATQCVAVSPAGTAGLVDVTVTTPSGTSRVSNADRFRYV